MKTRRTKRRNFIRRALAFLLCMTLIFGTGMQDVIEHVYAQDAAQTGSSEELTSNETTEPEGQSVDSTGGEGTEGGDNPSNDLPSSEDVTPGEQGDNTNGDNNGSGAPANTPDGSESSSDASLSTDADTDVSDSDNVDATKPSAPADSTPAGENGSGDSADKTPADGTGEKEPAEGSEGDKTPADGTEGGEDADAEKPEGQTPEDEELDETLTDEEQLEEQKSYEATADGVKVTVYAKAGVLPEDVSLVVTPIVQTDTEGMEEEAKAEAEAINEQYDATEKKLTEDLQEQAAEQTAEVAAMSADVPGEEAGLADENAAAGEPVLAGFLAYDISFLDENGEEIEPDGEVEVSIEFDEAVLPEDVPADAQVAVKHLVEDDSAEGGVTVKDITEDAEVAVTDAAAVEAVKLTTDSFSTFVITWSINSYRSIKITAHYVYLDEDGKTVDIPEPEDGSYTLPTDFELADGNTYDLSSSDSDYVIEIPGFTYLKTTIDGVNSTATEIEKLITSSEGYIFTTYYVKYTVKGSDEAKEWLECGSGDRQVTGDIYFVYKAADLTIVDNIIEGGDLQAVYTGEQTGGITYRWSKSDSKTGTYTPVEQTEYKNDKTNVSDDGLSLYPAYDNGARAWYKVEAVVNNQVVAQSAPYQVPYYNELQNGSFETPVVPANQSNMQYGNEEYVNAGGVWQSTGEVYGDYNKKMVAMEILHEGRGGGAGAYNWHGDWDNAAADGSQFAELNCEAAGALYQDVLTMEDTPLYYWLQHRARGDEQSAKSEFDTMYLVIMPTSVALKNELTTQDKLETYLSGKGSTIGQRFSEKGINLERNENESDEGIRIVRITSDDQDWQSTFGSYVPTSSLTRFFFVAGWTDADNGTGRTTPTQGNFLDAVGFSQDLPEIQDDEFTIRIQKNFEGLDVEHMNEVREKIQFNLSAVDNETKEELTEAQLRELFGKTYITGKEMTYAQGALSWVLPNRDIDSDASYTVFIEEVNADIDGYVMTTEVETSVTVGDAQPETSDEAKIDNLQGKTMAQVTFTNTYDRSDNKTVDFTKVWDDAGNKYGTRPKSLDVTLKATVVMNGVSKELSSEELGGAELTKTLTAPGWDTSWEVPVYYYPADGRGKIAIDYTVVEGDNTSDYEYEASEVLEGDPDDYDPQFDASSITQEAAASAQNGINAVSNSVMMAAPAQTAEDDFGAPSHHKYITYDAQTGEYTLNLDVTGKKGEAPGVDVLFVIDTSGSMGSGYGNYNLLPTVKNVLTKKDGVIDQILGTEGNNNRVAYISFSDKEGTNYSSWYDAEDNWDGYRNSLKSKINNLEADGGTNWTWAMYKAKELLRVRGNEENDVVVIFMSDGDPTYSMEYNWQGKYVETGWGSTTYDSYRTDAAAIVNSSQELKKAQLYSVYLNSNVRSGMKKFDDALTISNHDLVNGTDLQSGLTDILNKVIPEYKNVTITDVLSAYVEFAANPQITVTKKIGNSTTTLNSSQYELEKTGNSVKVTLLNGAALEEEATYTVSFKVKPSEKANEEYAATGYNAFGDPGTGVTSAGKNGFYSNDNEKTNVSYEVAGVSGKKTASYEKPVVQVTTHTLSYEKQWAYPSSVEKPTEDVTLKVTYSNGETKNITLEASKEYKYSETVSQNITIQSVEEVDGNPDYKVNYTYSQDKTSVTVVNNYIKETVSSVTVRKVWNDEGYEDERPGSVSVALYQSVNGGEAVQYGEVVELSLSNDWQHIWEDLLQTDIDGSTEISYTYEVREVNAPEHYFSSIGKTEWSEDGKAMTVTITNTYDENCADECYYIANVLQTDTVRLIKSWDDDSNNQEIRPQFLNITLSNGSENKVYQLSAADAGAPTNVWSKDVTLIARKNAQYSAAESLSEGSNYEQTASDTGVDSNGREWFWFENTIQTKSITVQKIWNDGDVQNRPEAIELELQYKVGDEWRHYTDIRITKADEWKVTVPNLPITNEYQIVEKNVAEGYISTTEVSADGNTYTVTNTLKWSLSKESLPEAGENAKPLAGAEFNLTDSSEKLIATGVSDENGQISWTPAEGVAEADLNKLDGMYTVTETKAPVGYQKLQSEWVLTFKNGLLTAAQASEGYEDYISEIQKNAEHGVTVVLRNSEIYELPSTGGPGIFLYMLSGSLLMMAGALLVYKKRKEEVLRS